jgi:hypothetical protein
MRLLMLLGSPKVEICYNSVVHLDLKAVGRVFTGSYVVWLRYVGA